MGSKEEESYNSEEEEDLEEIEDEDDGPGSAAFGSMLDAVLSRHFEYSQEDSTLSLAEILLLIKQSLDSQNAILGELLRLKMSKYGQSQRSSGASGSGNGAPSARQETPEERAARKARAAGRA